MKKNTLFVLVGLCLLPLFLKAQNNEYVVKKMFNLPVINVVDISCSGDNIYLNTYDSLFVVSKKGKIKDKKQTGYKQSVFLDSKRYTVENNVIRDESDNIVIDLTKKLEKEKKVMKYLAKSEGTFFTCVLDTPKVSYSSKIVQFNDDNNYFSFAYLVGIPSGLFSDGEFLWYLYNKSLEGENGMLRKYEINTGKLISEIEIPIKSPIGLHVEDKQVFTYSNFSGEFYQITIGGQ